ncbi:hypothetical protein SRHO_G00121060 [Serrasalmus rhombeus]
MSVALESRDALLSSQTLTHLPLRPHDAVTYRRCCASASALFLLTVSPSAGSAEEAPAPPEGAPESRTAARAAQYNEPQRLEITIHHQTLYTPLAGQDTACGRPAEGFIWEWCCKFMEKIVLIERALKQAALLTKNAAIQTARPVMKTSEGGY